MGVPGSIGNSRSGVISVDEFCSCDLVPVAEPVVECEAAIEKAVRQIEVWI